MLGLIEQPIGHLVTELLAQLLDTGPHFVNSLLAVCGVDGFGEACLKHTTGVYALGLEAVQATHDGVKIIDGAAGCGADLALQAVEVEARALHGCAHHLIHHVGGALAFTRRR
ncbi:hypothetical protein D3C71_1629590 [compost metagenome]